MQILMNTVPDALWFGLSWGCRMEASDFSLMHWGLFWKVGQLWPRWTQMGGLCLRHSLLVCPGVAFLSIADTVFIASLLGNAFPLQSFWIYNFSYPLRAVMHIKGEEGWELLKQGIASTFFPISIMWVFHIDWLVFLKSKPYPILFSIPACTSMQQQLIPKIPLI